MPPARGAGKARTLYAAQRRALALECRHVRRECRTARQYGRVAPGAGADRRGSGTRRRAGAASSGARRRWRDPGRRVRAGLRGLHPTGRTGAQAAPLLRRHAGELALPACADHAHGRPGSRSLRPACAVHAARARRRREAGAARAAARGAAGAGAGSCATQASSSAIRRRSKAIGTRRCTASSACPCRPPERPRRTTTRRLCCCCPRIAARRAAQRRSTWRNACRPLPRAAARRRVRQVRSRWRVIHDDQGRPARIVGVDIDRPTRPSSRSVDKLREDLDVTLRLGNVAVWRHDHNERPDLARRARLPADRPRAAARGVPLDERCRRRSIRTTSARSAPPQSRPRTGGAVGRGDPLPGSAAAGGDAAVAARAAARRRRAGGVHRRAARRDRACREGAAGAAVRAPPGGGGRGCPHRAVVGERGDALPTWNRRTFEAVRARSGRTRLPLADWLRRCVHLDDPRP